MIDLSKYNNSWYNPGSKIKIILWMIFSYLFFTTNFPFPNKIKTLILRRFGATIKDGVVIKPNVRIKYPWFLTIGYNSWIGEDVWIDNLCDVTIGDNCCISQGAMLLTGNHDYKSETFDLIIKEITLEDGCWVGAKSVVCPSITLHKNSILTVGSIATSNLIESSIYQGNPATFKKYRLKG